MVEFSECSEESLIALAKQGSRAAFNELVQRHYPAVAGVVYRMTGDARTADDSAQETFIRAWHHLPAYQPLTPLRSWLYRIAINVTRDALRSPEASRVESMEEADLPADPAPGPEAVLVREESAVLVRRAVAALPEASRAVVVLREFEGLSYQEIARVLDIPTGTVMSRLNYARTQLRKALQALLDEGR